MNQNLVGITGIARRLVQDGVIDESVARSAMEQASTAKIPLPQWFSDKKLVSAPQLAAANAVEFGMPLMDVSVFDASQNAVKLVSEELLQKYQCCRCSSAATGCSWGEQPDPDPGAGRHQVSYQPGSRADPRSTRTRSVAPWSNGKPAMRR